MVSVCAEVLKSAGEVTYIPFSISFWLSAWMARI